MTAKTCEADDDDGEVRVMTPAHAKRKMGWRRRCAIATAACVIAAALAVVLPDFFGDQDPPLTFGHAALRESAVNPNRAIVPLSSGTSIAFLFSGEMRTLLEPPVHALLRTNGLHAAAVGASGPHAHDSFWVLNVPSAPPPTASVARRMNATLDLLDARVVEIIHASNCAHPVAARDMPCCQAAFAKYGGMAGAQNGGAFM